MNNIQIETNTFTDTVSMKWKCPHCRFALFYLEKPKELENVLKQAMTFALNDHKCETEKN